LKFKNMGWLFIRLLRNSRVHVELHSKLFIVIKHGLENEIIKLCEIFFCETLTK
jgi:hypothetical protein